MQVLKGVSLGLRLAEIWQSASPLSHLAAKFSYLDETIKMAKWFPSDLQSSLASREDGSQ